MQSDFFSHLPVVAGLTRRDDPKPNIPHFILDPNMGPHDTVEFMGNLLLPSWLVDINGVTRAATRKRETSVVLPVGNPRSYFHVLLLIGDLDLVI